MSNLTTSDLHQIFNSLDQNDDGFLSLGELSSLLERLGVHATPDEPTALVGKDELSYEEFCNFYQLVLRETDASNDEKPSDEDEVVEDKESDLYKAFKVFDLNGDGLISSQELESVLRQLGIWDNSGGMDSNRIMHKYDANSDGFVDFDEFKTMMLAY